MCSNPVFINIIVSLGIVTSLAIVLIFFCVFIPRPKQESVSVIVDESKAIEEELLITQNHSDKEDRELMRQFLFPKNLLRQLAAKQLKEINIKKSREAQQRRMRFRKARMTP